MRAGTPERRTTLQIGPKTRIEDGDGAHAALAALERLAKGDIVAVTSKKDRAGTIAARLITLLDEPVNGAVV